MTEFPPTTDGIADIVDNALGDLANRRGAGLDDPLTLIDLITSLVDQTERRLPAAVSEARDHGRSWHEIARALHTSPEQARLWFDPDPQIAGLRR